MTSNNTKPLASIPVVKAICINNNDSLGQKKYEELHIGETFTPDYFVIERSSSSLYVRELPGRGYNTIMFDIQDGEGHRIDVRKEIIRPIMEKYRAYLSNEMALTGTWEVYVKLNDTPTNTVPYKNKYRIIRYGSFELEVARIGGLGE